MACSFVDHSRACSRPSALLVQTKHSAGGKAKRSKTESQGAFPEHRRVIPLTEELREAILAAHSSGVVLKKLKPEFHPDLKWVDSSLTCSRSAAYRPNS